MPFKIIFDDITTVKGDAIVNSLGTIGSVYGRLCKNIIEKADSKEIKDKIDSLRGNVGDITLTSGGKLPVDHIIHIVSPFKCEEKDAECSNLVSIYRKLFDFAISQGYKKIYVPFLGTGANGYSEEEAYNAVRKAFTYVAVKEEKIDDNLLDVNVVIFSKADKMRNSFDEEIECMMINRRRDEIHHGGIPSNFDRRNFRMDEEKERAFYRNELARNIVDIAELMGSLNPYNMFFSKQESYLYPFDFIIDWLKTVKHKNERTLVTENLIDKDRKKHLKKKKQLEKYEIYAIANEFGLSKEEIVEFMIINGTCFNPQETMDMFEVTYLCGIFGKLSKYEYSRIAEEETGIYISLDNGEYIEQLNEYKKSERFYIRNEDY